MDRRGVEHHRRRAPRAHYRLTTAGRKHLETERASWERASLAVRRIMSAES